MVPAEPVLVRVCPDVSLRKPLLLMEGTVLLWTVSQSAVKRLLQPLRLVRAGRVGRGRRVFPGNLRIPLVRLRVPRREGGHSAVRVVRRAIAVLARRSRALRVPRRLRRVIAIRLLARILRNRNIALPLLRREVVEADPGRAEQSAIRRSLRSMRACVFPYRVLLGFLTRQLRVF